MSQTRYLLSIFLLLLFFSVSCGGDRYGSLPLKLRSADSVMESDPATALEILLTVDSAELTSDHARAYYGVLMSMALDKNYIDTTDFSIIGFALDYYKDKGAPNERLRAYNYGGNIYFNQDSIEQAVQLLSEALVKGRGATDTLTLARIYDKLGLLYRKIFDFERAYDAMRKSSELFKAAGKTTSHFNTLLKCTTMTNVFNPEESRKCFAEARLLLPELQEYYLYDYYNDYLLFSTLNDSLPELKTFLERYLAVVPPEERDSLYLFSACYKSGNFEMAKQILPTLQEPEEIPDKITFLSHLPSYYYAIGDYKNAYETLIDYDDLYARYHIKAMGRDTRFLEERETTAAELEDRQAVIHRLGHWLWLIVALAVGLAVGLALVIRRASRLRRLNARLRAELSRSTNEAETLTKVIDDLNSSHRPPLTTSNHFCANASS